METLSIWLAMCEANLPFSRGFSSQNTSNTHLCCYHDLEQNVDQIALAIDDFRLHVPLCYASVVCQTT